MTEAAPTPGTETSPREAPRRSGREWLALGSLLVGLFLAFAATQAPWFVVVTTGSGAAPYTDTRAYGTSGWSATDTSPGMTATPDGNYLPWPALGAAFLPVSVLMWLAVVTALAALLLGYAAAWWPRLARGPVLLAFAGAALAFAGPLIFLATFPGAAQSAGLLPAGAGLWGSSNGGPGATSVAQTWTAGGAWSDLLAAGVFLLAGAAVLVRARRPARSAGHQSAP